MKRTAVKSSNVLSIGWEKRELHVEFASGGVYRYEDVPEDVFKALMASESKGKFLAQKIKPYYRSGRVPQPA